MNLDSAQKVTAILDATDTIERLRSDNRDKVNKANNGWPPLSAEAAKKLGLRINVNWMEFTILLKQAFLQYINASQSRSRYFSVDVPTMPAEQKSDWELAINQGINNPMKQSREFAGLLDNESASLVAHGIGPSMWLDKDRWLPEFVAINDLRVPTDTETSLKNLAWFAVRRRYTVGEIVRRVFGKYSDNGWDKRAMLNIMKSYMGKNFEVVNYDWDNNPEKVTSLVKQNVIYYSSDAVPTIVLWHFYHLDDTDPLNSAVYMKVVPDISVEKADRTKFLFNSDKPIAKKTEQLVQIQYGDLNGNPPFMHHEVRSLGFLLYEPCYWSNLVFCRLLQHTWENFNMILQGQHPNDRAKTQFIELFDKGWLPQDVQIVPNEKRHSISPDLVDKVMAMMKQRMGEAAAQYTQSTDTGTDREQTAYETSVKLNQVNSLMTGLLTIYFRNKTFQYREICRRFCNKKANDPDIREFWKACKKAGVPPQYLNSKLWNITPDVPLGSGNQTLELASATQLFNARAAYPPEAQQTILHIYTAAVTRNANMAQQLVPLGDKKNVTDAQRDAEFAFATLMTGTAEQAVRIKEELNPIDQIETLIGLTAGVVVRIEGAGNTATAQEVAGLSNVLQYTGQLVDQLSQDKEQKGRVTEYGKTLGKLGNSVKGFQQRLAESMNAKMSESLSIKFTDLDAYPAAQAAILASRGLPPQKEEGADPKVAKAVQGMQIKDKQAAQKLAHGDMAAHAEEIRKDAAAHAEILRKSAKAGADAATAQLKPEPETSPE